MYLGKLCLVRRRKCLEGRRLSLGTWSWPAPISFFIVMCILYSCGGVAAVNAADEVISGVSSVVPVPSGSVSTSKSSSSFIFSSNSRSVSRPGNVASASAPQPYHKHHQYQHNPHPHHRQSHLAPNNHNHNHNHNPHPQIISPPPAPPTEAYSPNWYNTHLNDPRMGFFFSNANTQTAPAPSLTVQRQHHPHNPQAPLVARPRSLPDFTPSFAVPSNKKKKRKNKVKKSKAFAAKAKENMSSTSTSASTKSDQEVVVVTSSGSTELALTSTSEPETSRTFLLTPILAWLIPVFIAQMFGMIPATALITLPIFLLPLGLGAAVFLL